MSIRKNKYGVWQIDFATPSGQRIRCSAQTTEKRLAQELHDKLKHEAWQVEKLDKKPERSIDDMLYRFLENAVGQKNLPAKIRHVEYWRNALQGKTLRSLTSDDIINNLPTHKKTGEKLSLATQNRYRSSIMRALSLARQAGWIDNVPFVQKQQEPKKRIRWITHQEAETLLLALNLPWMREICEFALMTGARMTEILTMTWDKVDLQRKIAIVTADIAKSGRGRPLLLNDDILLKLNAKAGEKIGNYVFHRGKGKLIKDIDREDFRRALKKTGIENFRFHDLRHTWASWHVQNGTPLMVLKELGGWETLEMVQKYAHLNADHLQSYTNHVKITSNTGLPS